MTIYDRRVRECIDCEWKGLDEFARPSKREEKPHMK
jgi:hypothetical protein